MAVIREFYPELSHQSLQLQQFQPTTTHYYVTSPPQTTVATAGPLVVYSPQASQIRPAPAAAGPVVVYSPPALVTVPTDGNDWKSPYEVPVNPLPIITRKHAVFGLTTAPRSLMETDLGDILLVSEFPNTLRHARLAFAPVLEVVNAQRSAQGLHPVSVHTVSVAHRQQKLVIDKYRHLAILCMPGSTIKHVNNPRDATDYKYLYNQLAAPKNEVLVFVVGLLSCPQLFAANKGLRPDPNHQGIFDPILRDSGIFQGDAVGLEKLKRGRCVSFVQNLNTAQMNLLAGLLHEMAQRSVHIHKAKAEYESF